MLLSQNNHYLMKERYLTMHKGKETDEKKMKNIKRVNTVVYAENL